MNKRELFIAAMKADLYKKLEWVISAFAISKETDSVFPYKIKSDVTGHYYLDPNTLKDYIKIEDGVANVPLYNAKEKLDITPDDIVNLKENITTTYGNLLGNYVYLIYAFKDKIPYINKKISLSEIEKFILPKFKSNPLPGTEKESDSFYVDEYLALGNAVIYSCDFAQLFTWGLTEKIVIPPDWVEAEKAKLIEQYKDRLNEAAVVAIIDAELVKKYKEYIKGDPGANFLISKKSTDTVAKKKYLMVGGELGLSEDTVNVKLVKNSLSEGWEISAFPEMNNTLRAGSYNRGALTVLGGVASKGLLRASANLNIASDDCGSRLGVAADIKNDNLERFVGLSVILKEGSKILKTKEDVGTYLGKRIMLRSPMYCKLDKTDYCKICLGERLANNPEGLSIAVSEYGSTFLSIFLSGAHSKSLQLAKLDWKAQLK
jgi:hypothetical protein